jgi:hypothetical protein
MTEDEEKRSRGRPSTGITPPIGLRLYPELKERIEWWIARQDAPELGLHEAIRRLLDEALSAAERRARRSSR